MNFVKASSYTSLEKKRGVCFQFSVLFKIMCGYCGIKSDVVGGYNSEDENAYGHAWNRSEIDGQVAYTDITWNMSRGDEFTLISKEELIATHQVYDLVYDLVY